MHLRAGNQVTSLVHWPGCGIGDAAAFSYGEKMIATATSKKHASSKPVGSVGRFAARARMSRRKMATAAAAVLALGLGYHVVFGRNGLISYEQKRLDSKTLDGELRSLERENEQLKGHVERLENDPDAIEHQAREELHYTRPGEVIYTLPGEPEKK